MSISALHTYGAACRLAPVSPPRADGGLDDIPALKAHFFYSSPIPLDDPLSTPTIVGANDGKSHKTPLKAFSPGDNNTLEKAWLAFSSKDHRRSHWHARRGENRSSSLSREEEAILDAVIQKLVSKHRTKHEREGQDAGPTTNTPAVLPDSSIPVCCSELLIDASAELRNGFCALTRKLQPLLDHDQVIERVMSELQGTRSDMEEMDGVSAPNTRIRQQSRSRAASTASTLSRSLPQAVPVRPPVVDDGISGMPFVRVGNEEPPQFSPPRSVADMFGGADRRPSSRKGDKAGEKRPQSKGPTTKTERQVPNKTPEHSVDIPVGISRLHQVTLPVLQMKPIYWSPVNDISIVMRGTWFYKDSMLPVEPDVANQLEAGYRELRPWSTTWADELRSALEVGALGEEKVSHPLWPEPIARKTKAKDGPPPEPLISSDPFCAAKCFQGEAAAVGTLEAVHPTDRDDGDGTSDEPKPFKDHHVIYKDGSHAYLLKPSLKPSAYYGRKPIAKIMRGLTVGMPVVRGFDWHAWEKSNNKRPVHSSEADANLGGLDSADNSETDSCPGCHREQALGQVTDLVLVAHGIGQKFAERVESFHFTHAVNAFRRAVNVELGSEAVKSVLRPGQNGIMVLPVNWRHILRFEEGGPMTDEDKAAQSADGFTLKDIEPNTIPAVRSMISDVMFDIPFYLSHHKPVMIAALVAEANRVYRLWCQNNPGFSQKGRVHLIAHSLGSAMALEILSKQPSAVPPLDLTLSTLPSPDRFEFDTKNLFLLGSPAGFFLLLERGNLIPRRGRTKPGADPSDVVDPDLVGDVGTFGCLAVDNIYNILAKEDPIAYLLNGTIDPRYAASLKLAYVPSTATSLLQSLMRGITGSGAAAPSPANTESTARKPLHARLPSQLELEVHDFIREDIAEKKAYLLNDNGQIDYYLRSGGGPLEMQYLNMLSAHSSYWYNPDLIRMLCMEIGRRPGRRNTLPDLRAVKSAKRQIPNALGRTG